MAFPRLLALKLARHRTRLISSGRFVFRNDLCLSAHFCSDNSSTSASTSSLDPSTLTREQRKLMAMQKVKEERKMRMRKKYMETAEDKLMWRIRKTKRKIADNDQRMKKYELPTDIEGDHDPEILTPEQLHALKKIGYKNRNYVPVGRRGIYGGTIENMHMHWKKHETVQLDCHMFPKEVIKDMAKELARLSGGIVIDIHQATTIILYRGKNYQQPEGLIPKNLLDKRKALFKSKYEQSNRALKKHLAVLEGQLDALQSGNPPSPKDLRESFRVSEELNAFNFDDMKDDESEQPIVGGGDDTESNIGRDHCSNSETELSEDIEDTETDWDPEDEFS